MKRAYHGFDCLTCRDAGQVPDPFGWGDDAEWLPCPARCESTIYREHCHECACGVDLEAPHGLCACGEYACADCCDPGDEGARWTCSKCATAAIALRHAS